MKSSLASHRFIGHFLFITLWFITSCQATPDGGVKNQKLKFLYKMQTPRGETINIKLAIDQKTQIQGLSGIRPHQIADNEGMLFVYEQSGPRDFWMPDTYMDLDLFYLDKNLVIIQVLRNLKAHPTRTEPPAIPRAPSVYARHVLELKSTSSLAKSLRQFEKLTFSKGQSLPKILRYTHLLK